MQAIEFQTTVKKIMSAIPKEKRGELDTHTDNDTVRVIVLASPHKQMRKHRNLLQEAKEKGYNDFFDYLLDYPLEKSNPIRYSREELHER